MNHSCLRLICFDGIRISPIPHGEKTDFVNGEEIGKGEELTARGHMVPWRIETEESEKEEQGRTLKDRHVNCLTSYLPYGLGNKFG